MSAFDIVMREPIPAKGAVLTQISAFWFERLSQVVPSHYLTALTGEIVERVPVLRPHWEQIDGRAMLGRYPWQPWSAARAGRSRVYQSAFAVASERHLAMAAVANRWQRHGHARRLRAKRRCHRCH